MAKQRIKSLPLAIGLNLLCPGLGYMYMGKIIVGIGAALLVFMIYLTNVTAYIIPTWLIMNLVMALDMIILQNKEQKKQKLN
mgnify:CR=1 FL=1